MTTEHDQQEAIASADHEQRLRIAELRSKVHHGYNLLASEAREVFAHYGEPIEAARKRCEHCGGSGWMWWHELQNHAGHDPASLVVDDTRYDCDACDGTGYEVAK